MYRVDGEWFVKVLKDLEEYAGGSREANLDIVLADFTKGQTQLIGLMILAGLFMLDSPSCTARGGIACVLKKVQVDGLDYRSVRGIINNAALERAGTLWIRDVFRKVNRDPEAIKMAASAVLLRAEFETVPPAD